VLSAIGQTTDHLVDLAYRISPRPQPRELDALVSLGESLACAVVAMAVGALGASAISLTAGQAGVLTDGRHGNAQLDAIRPHRILQALNDGNIVMIAGFQGISPQADVTTLGRGGSDASAVALAAALGVPSCEIFTDVPGVFTADPRLVADARQLAALDHDDMLLLSAAGAAVLQPRSVELAVAHDIAIHVRSSFSNAPGTWIRKEKPMLEKTRIIGVAHRRQELFYAVRDVSAAAVAAALARRAAVLGAIVRRRDELCFTAPGASEADVVAALEADGTSVRVIEDLGSVSVVGTGVGSRPEVAARVLVVLERLGVDPSLMVSTPGLITCHLPSPTVPAAVCALHDAFELGRGQPLSVAA
jgi:aspartate kinase